MSYTLESVMKKLGDDAQLVGGRVIVFRDGKHTVVGALGLHDNVFNLTADGMLMLDNGGTVIDQKPEVAEEQKPAKASRGLKNKPEASVEDVGLDLE